MIEIKKITRDDLKDLSSLFQELSGKKTDFEIMVKNFERINKNEDYIILGAYYKDKLVGSLMGIICHDLVGKCKPFMVIENVIVLRDFRDKSIGKKLMTEIERGEPGYPYPLNIDETLTKYILGLLPENNC